MDRPGLRGFFYSTNSSKLEEIKNQKSIFRNQKSRAMQSMARPWIVPPVLCGNTTLVAILENTEVRHQALYLIPGAEGSMRSGSSIVNVCILTDHTWDSNLDIYLIESDGTSEELSTDNGGLCDIHGDYSSCFR